MTATPAKKSSKKSKAAKAAASVAAPAPITPVNVALSKQAPPFRNRVVDKKALRNLVA